MALYSSCKCDFYTLTALYMYHIEYVMRVRFGDVALRRESVEVH